MRRRVRRAQWLSVAVALAFSPAAGWGQSAERLFEASAFRQAADSFADRADREPWVVAHWFNLGAALYGAGDEVAARAAWLRAARLAPRDRATRDALRRVPAPDPVSDGLTAVGPFTPTEAWLAGSLLWLGGWLLAGSGRRRRWALLLLALAVTAGAWAARASRRADDPIALVRQPNTPLRQAPYGTAPARRALLDGTALVVAGRQGGWLLVRRGPEAGWLLASEALEL